jgi:hypothetical protein
MDKLKYFLLGIISILLVSYTATNIQLFKPVKPSSITVDCGSGDFDEIKIYIKNTSTKRNVDGFILKDFEMTRNGSTYYYQVCLYFERY